MAGELDATRLAAKLWRLRNSDGAWSMGDEYGRDHTVHAPPSFTLTESPLPDGARPTLNPIDGEEPYSLRHTHVFDPDIVEPE